MAIRVCQLITELRPAGAERCVYDLATRLPAEGIAVEAVALRGGAMADALRQAGVPVHVLGVRCKCDLLRLGALTRILRNGRFDILHTHLFHADLAGRLANRSARVRHVVHSVHVAERRWRPWRFAWTRWGAYDRIVCVSAGVRDHHAARTHLPPQRYQVIHNGVDADRFRRSESARKARRAEWGVGEDDVLCAFVGRLDKQKGVDDLLSAFAAATRQRTGLRLVLAGEGPLRHRLERRIAQEGLAGRAQMLGFTSAVPEVLSAADVFLQPSRWEGFCLAAAEAMAAGLPVVAADVPGLNEVVADGLTGILCEPGDTAAFAAAIVALADAPQRRAALGEAGRQRVEDEFRIERFIARHAELYRQVFAGE